MVHFEHGSPGTKNTCSIMLTFKRCSLRPAGSNKDMALPLVMTMWPSSFYASGMMLEHICPDAAQLQT
jgi:hypothetical protein